jgi:hypothetical protein
MPIGASLLLSAGGTVCTLIAHVGALTVRRRRRPAAMRPQAQPVPNQTVTEDTASFKVRSVTGSGYTLIESTTFERLDRGGTGSTIMRPLSRTYRTAYACLPVVRNDDDSFTIVDTNTRLVRV